MVLGLVHPELPDPGLDGQGAADGRVGVVLGLIGLDQITAMPRLTFDRLELVDGIGLVPVVMGLFGVAEILTNIEQEISRDIIKARIGSLWPSKEDWKASAGPIARGTVLGFLLGILPGGGAVIASFASYAMEKKLSRTPERFGKGAIEGVAGPEAANNAAAGGAFIPLMTLGIPPNVVMALLLGAFVIHGLQPGPLMMTPEPRSVLGHRRQHVYRQRHAAGAQHAADRHVGAGPEAPYNILFPLIILFTIIGVYCSSNNVFDVYVMIAFGVIGYFMRKLGYEPAPLVLAFVLAPMLEQSLRQSLVMSPDGVMILAKRPVAALLLAASVVLTFLMFRRAKPKTREGYHEKMGRDCVRLGLRFAFRSCRGAKRSEGRDCEN